MKPESGSSTILVPCPDCSQLSPEPIEHLAEHDVVPCSLCMGLIDLTAENCRSIVNEAKTIRQSQSK